MSIPFGISVATMAHPKRKDLALDMQREHIAGTEIIWDRANNEWDTGRRALLAFDEGCRWHVVLQDDAVLCPDFSTVMFRALWNAHDGPVSFYIGKPRPYPREVNRAVSRALEKKRSFLEMRGPIWGVATAFPSDSICDMVYWCDRQEDPNYDSLLQSYWMEQGDKQCWYTLPCLANHNWKVPSLLPGHGLDARREAHVWKPDEVRTSYFDSGVYRVGDPTQPWTKTDPFGEDYICNSCEDFTADSLQDIIAHAGAEHEFGPVDLLAATPGSIRYFEEVLNNLPQQMRGTLWIAGQDFGQYAEGDHQAVRKSHLKNALAHAPDRFLICANNSVMNRFASSRSSWSLEGYGN
jgi:hypothetical protein